LVLKPTVRAKNLVLPPKDFLQKLFSFAGHEPLLTDEQHSTAQTGVESTFSAEPISIDALTDTQSLARTSFARCDTPTLLLQGSHHSQPYCYSSMKPSMQPSASYHRNQMQAEHAKRVIERAEE
jgi:hypothetical protein